MAKQQMEVHRLGRSVIVIGTDQIAEAAEFAGLSPTLYRWNGSYVARFVKHKDGSVSRALRSDKGRLGVDFSAVRPIGQVEGSRLIAIERERQQSIGYTITSDLDQADLLVRAARSYALDPAERPPLSSPPDWPWHFEFWHPSADYKRDLVKAGALIAAAIDVLQAEEFAAQVDAGLKGDFTDLDTQIADAFGIPKELR